MELKITKFMVIELVAAVVLVVVFVRLAGQLKRTGVAKGAWANALEAMIVFIRDQVARPAIGGHDADRFMPYLLTVFFFILACNLFGMIPWAGSPTGALATTGAMALLTFATVVVSGMAKLGVVGFWTGQVPHMDLPLALAIMLKPMIFCHRSHGAGHQALYSGRASFGQHDGRPHGVGGDHGVHCRQRRRAWPGTPWRRPACWVPWR